MKRFVERLKDGHYSTAEVYEPVAGAGFVAEWWISDVQHTLALGHIVLPVYGTYENEAVNRTNFITDQVVGFTAMLNGGLAPTIGRPSPHDRDHALMHVSQHSQLLPLSIGKIERTALLFTLARNFGVHDAAKLLAEVEGLKSVRTIHDRLNEARSRKLLTD